MQMLKALLTGQVFLQFLNICLFAGQVRNGESPSPKPVVPREVEFDIQTAPNSC